MFLRDIYDILLKNISLQFINSKEETVMHYCQEAFNAMLDLKLNQMFSYFLLDFSLQRNEMKIELRYSLCQAKLAWQNVVKHL